MSAIIIQQRRLVRELLERENDHQPRVRSFGGSVPLRPRKARRLA
ncbi:MAG: hypothetical protein RMM98_14295 [Acidobacteriota bacterium]|nr:hypothetical protein [Blastocatellia bacterium]MDW8240775.1 hypothetical protein [Acidobacteriota bacterium]